MIVDLHIVCATGSRCLFLIQAVIYVIHTISVPVGSRMCPVRSLPVHMKRNVLGIVCLPVFCIVLHIVKTKTVQH